MDWTDELISHPCALLILGRGLQWYSVSWDPLLLYRSLPLFSPKLPSTILQQNLSENSLFCGPGPWISFFKSTKQEPRTTDSMRPLCDCELSAPQTLSYNPPETRKPLLHSRNPTFHRFGSANCLYYTMGSEIYEQWVCILHSVRNGSTSQCISLLILWFGARELYCFPRADRIKYFM